LLSGYTEKFEEVYSLYNDKYSVELMVDLLAYYVMGQRYIKLNCNSPDYWTNIKKVEKISQDDKRIESSFDGEKLTYHDLKMIGLPYEVYLNAVCIVREFMLKQYEYQRYGMSIKADKDDIVIDAGACWGDTALYFAHEVGSKGKVYSFEFLPSNLKILKNNLSLNPDFRKLIDIVERPVWSNSTDTVSYTGLGPGNKIVTNSSTKEEMVTTIAIDDFIEMQNIPKVDFIKMDIEGAEIPALKGAITTLKRDRPKLAIAIYHSIDDFVDIPRFINDLNLGYKFYLDHYTIHWEETILYASID